MNIQSHSDNKLFKAWLKRDITKGLLLFYKVLSSHLISPYTNIGLFRYLLPTLHDFPTLFLNIHYNFFYTSKKVTEKAKMCSNYFKGYIMNLKWIYQRKRSSLSFKHHRYQETYDNSVLTQHTPRYIPRPTVYYNCRCARGGPSKPCRQRHCHTMLIYPLKTLKSNTGSSQIYNRQAGSMRI